MAGMQPTTFPTAIRRSVEAYNAHRESSHLLEAFKSHKQHFKNEFENLLQFITFWAHSDLLREIGNNDLLLKSLALLPEAMHDPISEKLLIRDSLNSSSIVFRTYVCMVLGRTDSFVKAVCDVQREARSREIADAISLLRNDGVRCLRNAISHGSFVARANSLKYQNGKVIEEFSFPELDQLNTSIVTILMPAWVASCLNY